jgi:hypothetical protein
MDEVTAGDAKIDPGIACADQLTPVMAIPAAKDRTRSFFIGLWSSTVAAPRADTSIDL